MKKKGLKQSGKIDRWRRGSHYDKKATKKRLIWGQMAGTNKRRMVLRGLSSLRDVAGHRRWLKPKTGGGESMRVDAAKEAEAW